VRGLGRTGHSMCKGERQPIKNAKLKIKNCRRQDTEKEMSNETKLRPAPFPTRDGLQDSSLPRKAGAAPLGGRGGRDAFGGSPNAAGGSPAPPKARGLLGGRIRRGRRIRHAGRVCSPNQTLPWLGYAGLRESSGGFMRVENGRPLA
jgi:hypothetical protein